MPFRHLILIALFHLLLCQPTLGQDSCPAVFIATPFERQGFHDVAGLSFNVVEGTLVNTENGVEIWRLGAGIMGGTVYRHRPLDGFPPYLVKEYNDPRSLRNDAKMLALLTNARVRSPEFSSHAIAKVTGIEGNKMRMQDIRGTDIQQIFFNLSRKEARLQFKQHVVRSSTKPIARRLTMLKSSSVKESRGITHIESLLAMNGRYQR